MSGRFGWVGDLAELLRGWSVVKIRYEVVGLGAARLILEIRRDDA